MRLKESEGTPITWDEYADAISSRFGLSPLDDLILDLKNLKQTSPVTKYYCIFTALFHRVQLLAPMTERQALSQFLGGVKL